jgi:hypothetical protein
VHIDPIKLTLKASVTTPVKLKCDEPVSFFAFKFNLRRYTKAEAAADADDAAAAAILNAQDEDGTPDGVNQDDEEGDGDGDGIADDAGDGGGGEASQSGENGLEAGVYTRPHLCSI